MATTSRRTLWSRVRWSEFVESYRTSTPEHVLGPFLIFVIFSAVGLEFIQSEDPMFSDRLGLSVIVGGIALSVQRYARNRSLIWTEGYAGIVLGYSGLAIAMFATAYWWPLRVLAGVISIVQIGLGYALQSSQERPSAGESPPPGSVERSADGQRRARRGSRSSRGAPGQPQEYETESGGYRAGLTELWSRLAGVAYEGPEAGAMPWIVSYFRGAVIVAPVLVDWQLVDGGNRRLFVFWVGFAVFQGAVGRYSGIVFGESGQVKIFGSFFIAAAVSASTIAVQLSWWHDTQGNDWLSGLYLEVGVSFSFATVVTILFFRRLQSKEMYTRVELAMGVVAIQVILWSRAADRTGSSWLSQALLEAGVSILFAFVVERAASYLIGAARRQAGHGP